MHKYIKRIIIYLVIIINLSSLRLFVIANTQDSSVENERQTTLTADTIGNFEINSHIGLIYDRNSGRVLYEKNGYEKYKMASTTKIMTAIVVIENCNMTDTVIVDKKAAGTGGSRLGLKTNDKITVNDLLYGLMLESGNDAAVALANHVSGSVEEFAKLMNKKAKELGLKNTNFVVPHGLDNDEHYTTAYELAIITDYALNNEIFRNIVKTKTYNVNINGKMKQISNTNELLGNLNGIYGVKTGFTNGAGRCLVTACKRGEMDIITVVLGADTKKIRTSDSTKLIEYANKNFEVINIKEMILDSFEKWKEEYGININVYKGITNRVNFDLSDAKYERIALSKSEKENIEIDINNLFNLEAPINKNYKLGEVSVKINQEIFDILDIITIEEIKRKGVKDYFCEILGLIY